MHLPQGPDRQLFIAFGGILLYLLVLLLVAHVGDVQEFVEISILPIVLLVASELAVLPRKLILHRAMRMIIWVATLGLTALLGAKEVGYLIARAKRVLHRNHVRIRFFRRFWRRRAFFGKALLALPIVAFFIAAGWLLVFVALSLPAFFAAAARHGLLVGFDEILNKFVKPAYKWIFTNARQSGLLRKRYVRWVRLLGADGLRRLRRLHYWIKSQFAQ